MNENGSDRELVLGNKQLLAIFFVAALLCGVFFAVGYVVGGNSAKSSASAVADSSSTPAAEGKRDEAAANAPNPDAFGGSGAMGGSGAAISDTAGMSAAPEPQMSDNPAAAGSAPPPAATAQAAPAPAPPPTRTAPVTKPASPPAAAAEISLSTPEKGSSYVQVAAQTRPQADELAKTLRERGYPTILAESSQPNRVEVLVGPYSGVALADAKRKLIDLGFAGAFVHKQQ
ncbi:MAG TPA: SPOR domain-containing protein [Bryobacteraceae bacterium]|nr:SPOR domain-containing protein [Bryobacteraceae bacterium]